MEMLIAQIIALVTETIMSFGAWTAVGIPCAVVALIAVIVGK